MIQRQEVSESLAPKLKDKKLAPIGFYSKFSGMTIKNGDYKIGLLVEENGLSKLQYTKYKINKEAGKIKIEEDFESYLKLVTAMNEDITSFPEGYGSLDILNQKTNDIFYAYGWGGYNFREDKKRDISLILSSEVNEYTISCDTIYRYGLLKALDPEVNESLVVSPAFETYFSLKDITDGEYKVFIEIEESSGQYINSTNARIIKQNNTYKIQYSGVK